MLIIHHKCEAIPLSVHIESQGYELDNQYNSSMRRVLDMFSRLETMLPSRTFSQPHHSKHQ